MKQFVKLKKIDHFKEFLVWRKTDHPKEKPILISILNDSIRIVDGLINGKIDDEDVNQFRDLLT